MSRDWELHLDPSSEFPKRFGKKVKAAGGKYSECRGYCDRRYVTVPSTCVELIDALLAAYPIRGRGHRGGLRRGSGTCAVLQPGTYFTGPAWVIVQYGKTAAELESGVEHAAAHAVKRGYLSEEDALRLKETTS